MFEEPDSLEEKKVHVSQVTEQHNPKEKKTVKGNKKDPFMSFNLQNFMIVWFCCYGKELNLGPHVRQSALKMIPISS